MLGEAVAARGPGPLIPEVDIGDDRDPMFHVERPPLGSQDPAIWAGDHGETSLWWSRLSASPGASNRIGSGPPGSIQAAANGDGPSSDRK